MRPVYRSPCTVLTDKVCFHPGRSLSIVIPIKGYEKATRHPIGGSQNVALELIPIVKGQLKASIVSMTLHGKSMKGTCFDNFHTGIHVTYHEKKPSIDSIFQLATDVIMATNLDDLTTAEAINLRYALVLVLML